ncbi:MAG: hypothetical protein WC384_17665 [Prolixibacteraceae bacterium]
MKTKLLFLFLLAATRLFSQDFYNHDNSLKFGEYLYHSNQYDLAVREFERCVFLKPDDRQSYLFLFKIYRKTNAFEKAIESYKQFSGKTGFIDMDQEFGSEYFKLLVQNEKYEDAGSFINSNDFFKQNSDFKLSTILLRKSWKEAGNFKSEYEDKLNRSLVEIADQGQALKRKSPALAGILSVIIPGSGKVYSGRWKDGLISFLMTSTTAFMAVRGFNKNPKSFYPWAMGTLSVVYYSGNIYGSTQTANKYNKDKENELVNKTRDFILRDN